MRRCGDIAFYNLLSLWSFVSQNRPDGDLSGLDQEDIEIACNATSNATSIYQALLDLGFLEQDEKGGLFVHDWEEHNGFACFAKERSKKAKNAAKARWARNSDNTVEKKNDATSIGLALLDSACSNAPSPSPSPSPSPEKDIGEKSPDDSLKKKTTRFVPPSEKDVITYCRERNKGVDPVKWLNFYQAKDWMIGKNKMKDWKAAVRTWEKGGNSEWT
jgi:hypothetical protein